MVTISDYTTINYDNPPAYAELKTYVQVQPVPRAIGYKSPVHLTISDASRKVALLSSF